MPTQSKSEPENGAVALISMPFGHPFYPSIALASLKSTLADQGIDSQTFYFGLRFAEQIGADAYLPMSMPNVLFPHLHAGEWIFSNVLFGHRNPDVEQFVDSVRESLPRYRQHEFDKERKRLVAGVTHAQEMADSFLQSCLEQLCSGQLELVAFTVKVSQTLAALALAQLIKHRRPQLTVVLGGPACREVMGVEMLRQFPFVDGIISGEGEIVFVETVRRALAGQPLSGIRGVYTRSSLPSLDGDGRYPGAVGHSCLDSLPLPDYRDFFDQLAKTTVFDRPNPNLLMETSRGCWWGDKSRCAFCSETNSYAPYRSKSGKRAFAELEQLSQRHPDLGVQLADKSIDPKHFTDFFPALRDKKTGPPLCCQVRTGLTKDQIRLLHDAGMAYLQIGIESLSSPILRLMRKGTRAIRNIEMLKWCKECGVTPRWNLLWGMPGEPVQEYERMARLVPFLSHLRPPLYTGAFLLYRFSPYFEDPTRFGLKNLRPSASAFDIWPLHEEAVSRLAFYFDFEYDDDRDVEQYTTRLREACILWRMEHRSSHLFSVERGEQLFVWDTRPSTATPLTVWSGTPKQVLAACDEVTHKKQLKQRIEKEAERSITEVEIDDLLGDLVRRGLLIEEKNAYLSLVVPVGAYRPPDAVFSRFTDHLAQHEARQAEALDDPR